MRRQFEFFPQKGNTVASGHSSSSDDEEERTGYYRIRNRCVWLLTMRLVGSWWQRVWSPPRIPVYPDITKVLYRTPVCISVGTSLKLLS
jgi:hypothetical protein